MTVLYHHKDLISSEFIPTTHSHTHAYSTQKASRLLKRKKTHLLFKTLLYQKLINTQIFAVQHVAYMWHICGHVNVSILNMVFKCPITPPPTYTMHFLKATYVVSNKLDIVLVFPCNPQLTDENPATPEPAMSYTDIMRTCRMMRSEETANEASSVSRTSGQHELGGLCCVEVTDIMAVRWPVALIS